MSKPQKGKPLTFDQAASELSAAEARAPQNRLLTPKPMSNASCS